MSRLLSGSFFPTESVPLLGSAAVDPGTLALDRSVEEIGAGGPTSMLTQRVSEAFVALLEACSIADSDGWDGYRGQSVSVGSFLMAEALLRTVPADVPMPEIDVHPDGQVGFDWVVDRHRMFSLAISDSGTIAFASMRGDDKVTGREVFTGTFPPSARFHLGCLLAAD